MSSPDESNALDPNEIPAGLADWSRSFFDVTERNFDSLGYRLAAENLRRYRSGNGEERVFSDDEIGQYSSYLAAEDNNRTLFARRSLVGRASENAPITTALRALADGETIDAGDYFITPARNLEVEAFLAFGRSGVRSDMLLSATRAGNDIVMEGTVSHGFGSGAGRGESFDFNRNALGSEHAQVLEALGEARPFTMQYDRSQDFTARVRREPDGALTLRDIRWGPIR